MSGEILSIETTQKIARLEKENKEMSEIIFKFDAEVNKQFQIIRTSYNLLKSNPDAIEDVLNILNEVLDESQR
jgi:5-bromo-4-chloroindolyl phosphate hydrolysis protein